MSTKAEIQPCEHETRDRIITGFVVGLPFLLAIVFGIQAWGKSLNFLNLGMFIVGYVLTKMGGMRHVYFYLTEYRSLPLEKAKHDIRIVAPIANQTRASCHTMQAPAWAKVPDHASSLSEVKDGTLACTSPGCHGFAHPGTKLGKELLLDGGAP